MALLALAVLLVATIAPGDSTFDEFLFDKFQQRNVRCVGQSTHELSCTSGLCYNSLHIKTNIVSAGCASPATCVESGCMVDETTDTFVCCCEHSFCNGKSATMAQARWQMFARGEYGGNDVLRSLATRDVSTGAPSEVQSDSPQTPTMLTSHVPTESPLTESTTKETTPTAAATSIITTIAKETTTPTTIISPKTTVVRTTLLSTSKNLNTFKTTVTNLASTVTTTIPKIIITSTHKNAAVATKSAATKKFIAKVTNAPAAPRTNFTRPAAKRVMATTRLPPYVLAKSLNATTRPRSTVQTTKAPITKTSPIVINDIFDAPTSFDAANGAKLPEYRPRTTARLKSATMGSVNDMTTATVGSKDGTPEIRKKVETKLNAALVTTVATVAPPFSDRTTSPPSAASSEASTSTAPRRRHTAAIYHSFPWHFVVVLGFVIALAVFTLVIVLLRRCYPHVRHLVWHAGFRRRDSQLYIKEDRNSNAGDTVDDYVAYSNGSVRALTVSEQMAAAALLDVPKPKREPRRVSFLSAFRFQCRAAGGAPPPPFGPLIKSAAAGATNDSLASHCTMMTTASAGDSYESAAKDCELTVIDPLLKKQYTGTIHISPAAKIEKH